jgi:hypothetical protein
MKALLATMMIALAVTFTGCAGEEAAPEGEMTEAPAEAPAE